jgi:hypothetical protein
MKSWDCCSFAMKIRSKLLFFKMYARINTLLRVHIRKNERLRRKASGLQVETRTSRTRAVTITPRLPVSNFDVYGDTIHILLGYSAVYPICESTFRRRLACSEWSGNKTIQPEYQLRLAYCQFLAQLIFHPEDWYNTFLRNIASHTDYIALYLRTTAVRTSNNT